MKQTLKYLKQTHYHGISYAYQQPDQPLESYSVAHFAEIADILSTTRFLQRG